MEMNTSGMMSAATLSLRIEGKLCAPDNASWDASSHKLTLGFSSPKAKVILTAEAKPTHIVFEVIEVAPKESVELILWGPYPTTITRTVGEVIGVIMRKQNMGDPVPIGAGLHEVHERAWSEIEQQGMIGLNEVAGCRSFRMDVCPRTKNRQAHYPPS